MPKPLTVFLPYSGQDHTRRTIEQLQQSPLVERICLLATGGVRGRSRRLRPVVVDNLYSSRTMRTITQQTLLLTRC